MKIKDYLLIDKETTLISLSYLLGQNRNYFLLNQDLDLENEISTKLNDIIYKVENGYPLQYAIGVWNFYGLDFITDKRALIPRPETEILVEKIIKKNINKDKILDIGTGTGAIAISLAYNLKNSKVVGLDISKDAISLANENKEKLNVTNVKFIESDLFSNINEKFNVIVSNPPYINKKDYEALDKKLFYEPQNALLGGEDGLYFYNKIIKNAKSFMEKNAYIFFEIGYNQKEDVIELLKEENYIDINSYKDYNGLDRIISARV